MPGSAFDDLADLVRQGGHGEGLGEDFHAGFQMVRDDKQLHLEMVGKLIAQHTSKIDQETASNAPIFKIKGGGPHYIIDARSGGIVSKRYEQ